MLLKEYSSQFFKSTLTFLLLFFVLSGSIFSQEKEVEKEQKTETIIEKAIAINDISTESEKLVQRILKLRDILKPSEEINIIDSLIAKSELKIILKRDSLYSKIEGMSQRRLKAKMVEWGNYKISLKNYQDVMSNRLADVTDVNKEMLNELEKWNLTKEKLSVAAKEGDVYSTIDTVINSLEEIVQISIVRIDSIFIIQRNLTNLVLSTDKVISEIRKVQHQLQRNYFVFDGPLIWQLNKIDSIATDTTNKISTNSLTSMKLEMDENITSFKDFFSKNQKTAIFQILFLLAILILLIVVKKQWHKELGEHTVQAEKETIMILKHPVASTLAVGLLISAFFYKLLIPTVIEIHIIIILSATTYLLPRLSTKRFTIFLSLLLFIYVSNIVESYLVIQSFLYRFILLLSALTLIFAMIIGQREIKKKPEFYLHLKVLFKYLVPVSILLLVAAVVANIIGMVHLSFFLIRGILFSTILGVVVYLTVKIITSIFVLLIQFVNSTNTQAFSTMVKVAQKRLKPILFLIGLFVWIIFSLKSFELYEYLLENINELLLIEWRISNLTISVGGILSFGSIFMFAILLANLVAAILQDEWLIKLLPRGVAPAISLMLRIIIITIGLYASLTAAKVPLNQLGFIVGALGVGIGFGLQNIVLNFVAGLILAFERPINLGDTIEVDMEKGIVTSIGVRSSNIKTYTGAEAIIPNGDLISKKVINWTLSNRDRRSRVLMKTAIIANPEEVIEMFNQIASEQPSVFHDPAPWTHFYGFNLEGNLDFALHYWTSFDDTLSTDNDIALKIYQKLKEKGIQAPIPTRRVISD